MSATADANEIGAKIDARTDWDAVRTRTRFYEMWRKESVKGLPMGLQFDSSGIILKVKEYHGTQAYDRFNSPGQPHIIAYEDQSPDVVRDAYRLTSL